jgi:hypothetical protein
MIKTMRSFDRRIFDFQAADWWQRTSLPWMASAFVVAFVATLLVLAIFGTEERGTEIALRITARWSFALFWLAYTGSALTKLFGPRLVGSVRHGRQLGLAFASAQLVHVGLVLWLIRIAPEPLGAMLFFWVGILCTYLLALFSMPYLRKLLGIPAWTVFHTIALEYIALVFAADFILIPLQSKGLHNYPWSYYPFALLLLLGVSFRVAAHLTIKFPGGVAGS